MRRTYGVLDGDDVVLLAEGDVEGGELLSGEPLGGVGVGVLEAASGSEIALEIKVAKRTHSRSYLPSL